MKKTAFWKNIIVVWGSLFLILGLAAFMMLALTGCGHNIGTAFSGKFANVGYDPEFNKFGIQYYDGVIVTGLNKENTETKLSFEDSAEGNGGYKTGTKMTYDHKTGDQVTGYRVDLEEAKAKNQAVK